MDWMMHAAQRMRNTFLACLLCSLGSLTPLRAEDASPPQQGTPATLMLLWTPQSQFAGYYVALEKGFYKRRGLDVTLVRGGPDRDQVEYLKGGKADFAILWLTTALAARDKGEPVTHLGQVINRSNLALVGWKDRGIRTVKDLDKRRISIWGGSFRPPFMSYFRANGVKPDILLQNYSINLFLRHGVDACSVMRYNEYHVLYQCGVEQDELTTFFLSDFDCPLPEDGLYCLENTVREKPEVCRAIMEASMEGWRYAADHREEALDIVMKEVHDAHVPANRAHMRWMLNTMVESIFPPKPGDWQVGILNGDAYRKTVKMMKQAGLIGEAPPFKSFTAQGEGVHVP
jgi:NitT/TauT family transport system substrate-binding protein